MVQVTPYPVPTPERREIVRRLSDSARALDEEASKRLPIEPDTWNAVTVPEIRRAAGVVRFASTLVVNGSMPDVQARFALDAAESFVRLVRRADRKGIVR